MFDLFFLQLKCFWQKMIPKKIHKKKRENLLKSEGWLVYKCTPTIKKLITDFLEKVSWHFIKSKLQKNKNKVWRFSKAGTFFN